MNTLPKDSLLGNLSLIEVFHYYDGPKLFSCKNNGGQIYFVLWLGDEELDYRYDRWMYVPVSVTRIQHIKSGQIDLRSACINPEDGFIWIVNIPFDSSLESNLEFRRPELVADEDFPEKGAKLNIKVDTIEPIEELSDYSKHVFVDVLDIALEEEDTKSSQVSSRALGQTLINIQDCVDYIYSHKRGYKSYKIPSHVLEKSRMQTVDAFPSSFGLRLEAHKASVDLFGQSELQNSINILFKIISAGDNIDNLLYALSNLNSFVVSKYLSFTRSLAKNHVSFKASWASPNNIKTSSVSITWKQAYLVTEILSDALENFVDVIYIENGSLLAIDVDKGSFKIKDGSNNEKYEGKIDKGIIEYAKEVSAKVPGAYEAVIERYNKIRPGDKKIVEIYNLKSLKEK
ncbi:DUF6575 domain-containing protein [Hymenobacter pini]|uniref:DUF6575 domain-containing protein n=1 Tax=Hymenobacter pini TaxID=2880879 RepID=UPI001CF468B2|nr:DUF6575 domain-containing protein [Hymenobacter pini]MCA8832002.1 hypothetical protein [Hymenobacter pini]